MSQVMSGTFQYVKIDVFKLLNLFVLCCAFGSKSISGVLNGVALLNDVVAILSNCCDTVALAE